MVVLLFYSFVNMYNNIVYCLYCFTHKKTFACKCKGNKMGYVLKGVHKLLSQNVKNVLELWEQIPHFHLSRDMRDCPPVTVFESHFPPNKVQVKTIKGFVVVQILPLYNHYISLGQQFDIPMATFQQLCNCLQIDLHWLRFLLEKKSEHKSPSYIKLLLLLVYQLLLYYRKGVCYLFDQSKFFKLHTFS